MAYSFVRPFILLGFCNVPRCPIRVFNYTLAKRHNRASSVLQNNTKEYGASKALDCENALSSWNSEGSPDGKKENCLVIDFGETRTVKAAELSIQFQAGFAAEELTVYTQESGSKTWSKAEEIEAEDDHEMQAFPLSDAIKDQPIGALKIVFHETTDFYGRVIVYQLQVWGQEIQ